MRIGSNKSCLAPLLCFLLGVGNRTTRKVGSNFFTVCCVVVDIVRGLGDSQICTYDNIWTQRLYKEVVIQICESSQPTLHEHGVKWQCPNLSLALPFAHCFRLSEREACGVTNWGSAVGWHASKSVQCVFDVVTLWHWRTKWGRRFASRRSVWALEWEIWWPTPSEARLCLHTSLGGATLLVVRHETTKNTSYPLLQN